MLYSRFLFFVVVALYSFGSLSAEIHDLARADRWTEVLTRLFKGAEINERDDKGKTLLDIATKANREDVVLELIRMGAEGGLNDTTANTEISIDEQGPVEANAEVPADEPDELNDSEDWPLFMITPAEVQPLTPHMPNHEQMRDLVLDLTGQFEGVERSFQ